MKFNKLGIEKERAVIFDEDGTCWLYDSFAGALLADRDWETL